MTALQLAKQQKIFSLAVGATKIFFCLRTAKNFFNQPISGCFILDKQ